MRYDEISIVPQFEAFKASLASEFAGLGRGHDRRKHSGPHPGHAVDGAVQQVRQHCADHRQQVSEMATGYCTLYGDMAGGFAVIKDVAKTTVFRLARWRNAA